MHRNHSIKKFFNYKIILWIIGFFSILIALTIWLFFKHYTQERAQDRFDAYVREIVENLNKRIASHEHVLHSCAGFFKASDEVTREEWHDYIEELQLKKYYPGIQGIGWSIMLDPEEVIPFENRMRAQWDPSFTFNPKGERSRYSSIIFLEPMDRRNAKAIGYDMFSESTRRDAMETARDTGDVIVSGRVTLKQEIDSDVQPGILMYHPMYKTGEKIETIEQRRNALIGFVYSTFRMNDFMSHIVSNDYIVDLEIYDNKEISNSNLIYRSFKPSAHISKYYSRQIINVSGRKWHINFYSTPQFDSQMSIALPLYFSLGGILVYLVLLITIGSLFKSSRLVQEKNKELEAEKHTAQNYLDIANVMILILDHGNNVVLINKRGCEIMGYRADEMIGKNWIENFIPVLFRTKVDVVSHNLKEKNASFDYFENPVLTKSGEERLITWKNTPLLDEDGISIGILTSGEDITQMRLAQKQLQESQQYLETIIQTEPECVKVVDKNGYLLEMNAAGLAMLEADTLEEVQQCGLTDYLLPAGRKSFVELHRRVMNGESGTLAFEVKGLKGTRRWLETHAAPMRNDQGDVIALLGITRDITEKRKADELLHQSETFYRTIFASVYEGIFILENNFVVDCNDKALELLEVSKEQLIGTSLQNSRRYFKCEKYNFDHYLNRAYAGENIELKCTMLIDQEINHAKVIEIGIGNFEGNDRRLIVIARDITKQLEDDKYMVMQSRQAQMGEMLSIIAHQWRQPLTIINSITANLRIKELMSSHPNFSLLEIIETIEKQILYLSNTITDFKDFFNPDKSKEEVKLSQIVYNAVNLMDHVIKNDAIDVKEIVNKDRALMIYQNEMLQVIITLLKNSVDAFKQNKIMDRRIMIEIDEDETDSIITISDNAGGIPDHVINSIFLPYFTTKSELKGTGLGLYMSKMIIENRINGVLEVQSQGHKTAFTIKIPLSKEES